MIFNISSWSNLFPVGLLGLAIKIIFVLELNLEITLSISIWKFLSNSIFIFSTSLIFEETLYIPYVGFKVIILSTPGLQKTRITKSINSSVPLHRTKFSALIFFITRN